MTTEAVLEAGWRDADEASHFALTLLQLTPPLPHPLPATSSGYYSVGVKGVTAPSELLLYHENREATEGTLHSVLGI